MIRRVSLFGMGVLAILAVTSRVEAEHAESIGLGIASPEMIELRTLRLYDTADVESAPVDSVTFHMPNYSYSIASAPPDFSPESVKLDYEILNLRVIGATRSALQVVVNRESGATAWVSRDDVTFQHWPEFLLTVFAVESVDYDKHPVRLAPSPDAEALITNRHATLFPIAVHGDWLKVEFGTDETVEDDNRLKGWVRWRDGEGLLVMYSILS